MANETMSIEDFIRAHAGEATAKRNYLRLKSAGDEVEFRIPADGAKTSQEGIFDPATKKFRPKTEADGDARVQRRMSFEVLPRGVNSRFVFEMGAGFWLDYLNACQLANATAFSHWVKVGREGQGLETRYSILLLERVEASPAPTGVEVRAIAAAGGAVGMKNLDVTVEPPQTIEEMAALVSAN